jgi:chromosome segregation ATPase
MKKYAILLLFLPFVFACNQEEVKKMNEENQRLAKEAVYKDSTINDFIQSMNQIEANLSSIKDKETDIKVTAKAGVEKNEDAKVRIQQSISDINQMMSENKNMIATLQKKLRNSEIKISAFNKMIARLNKDIAQRDSVIGTLKQQLETLNFKVETLTTTVDTLNKTKGNLERANKDKAQIIEAQTNALNTAYFVVGTTKELKTRGVMTKKFLSSSKMNPDADNSAFSKIDITKTSNIPLPGKKAHLATAHESGTYRFEGPDKKADRLVITNPDRFWKTSKYCVIVID